MGQTRMFRDRVVSMEQTLEGGEKHLPLLKALCAEALPDLVFREHSLDHERDMFVMDFDAPDGAPPAHLLDAHGALRRGAHSDAHGGSRRGAAREDRRAHPRPRRRGPRSS